MGKRGQATVFIILGVLLVLAVVLYFVLVRTEVIPPFLGFTDAGSELAEIEEHVEGCLEEVGVQYLTEIGLQGGYLSPGVDTYRLYNDSSVAYLCYNQIGLGTCTNRLLTLEHMDEELTTAVSDGLSSCVNVYDFSKDVEAASEWTLAVDIALDTVQFVLDYPITVDKGEDDVASVDRFTIVADVPLGELYQVSQDVVNAHATAGDFDPLLYMLSQQGKYLIYKNKPYPDTVYQVSLREGSYTFQFAIQGEEST